MTSPGDSTARSAGMPPEELGLTGISEPARREQPAAAAATPAGAGARSAQSVAPAVRPVGIVDHGIGLALGATYVGALLRTADTLGYARDEGFYYRAAQSYASWFELLARDPRAAFARQAIDGAWGVNHEHPALIKSLFALSWMLLHNRLHLFEEGTSLRFPAMCLAGAGLWLLYIWGSRACSRIAGLAAVLSFALMPRVFYQSHLDCFDIPIATMWALAAYAYWRSLGASGLRWPLLTGVLFGLALETKHNSWFLPFVFVGHALLTQGGRMLRDLRTDRLRVPLALFTSALIGPALFVGLWPYLWFDTFARIKGYADFHLHHEYYNMVFLGANYFRPPMPRGYAWLMTAATVPTITLALFAIGLGWSLRRRIVPRAIGRGVARVPRDPAHTELYWLVCMVACYSPWFSSSTPIFGGTKHWMTAYPFLCLFAGVGFDKVRRTIGEWLETGLRARPSPNGLAPRFPRAGSRALAPVLLYGTVFAAPLAETVHSHPWGLSNYTPLVGGASGAASLGLNRQFWGFTTGAVTDFLNEHVVPGGGVYLHDTAWDSWELLRRDERLAPFVQASYSIPASSFSLYHHEEHMEGVEYQIWVVYGTTIPVHIGVYDGVPIVYVYARPGAMR